MSRRSFRKQLLSFILCLCMVLSLMSTAVLGADCVNHTDADMDGVCDACGNACTYTVNVDGTVTDYTDFDAAVEAARSAEAATLTLYQNAPQTSYYFSRGNVVLDLNGMTCEGTVGVSGGTLTLMDSAEQKGTVTNTGGMAIAFFEGKLFLSETVDLQGLADGHEVIRLGLGHGTDTATIGSTGEEDIVIPESMVAIDYITQEEISVLTAQGNPVAVHQHNWTEATCTEASYCPDCGAYAGVPLGHSYDEGVERIPTCTERGGVFFTCATCGDTYAENEIPAPGHHFESDICTVCGAHAEIVINLSDNYGDGWNGNALQIYEDGVLLTTATIEDGSENTVTVPKDSQKGYEFVWVKGEYAGECSFEIVYNVETLFECNNCSGFIDGETVYIICAHSYGPGVETEASCTGKGGIFYTCTKCGDIMIENEVPALGHSFGDDDICDICGMDRPMTVVLNLTDSYGDGWNDCKIEIVTDQETVDVVTLTDGSEATVTVELNPGKDYDFCWYEGDCSSECAFEVFIDGEWVFQQDSCDDYKDGELILSIIDGEVVVPVIERTVYVGGTVLTNGEYLDLAGNVSTEEPTGGYAYFDGTVLTLNDYTYTGNGCAITTDAMEYVFLIYTESDMLEIEVLGTNSMTCTAEEGFGIGVGEYYGQADLTLSGTGTLTMSGIFAVSQLSDLTINDGTYKFEAQYGIVGYEGEGFVTVNGGELDITTSGDLFSTMTVSELTLNAGKVIVSNDNGGALQVSILTVKGGYLEVKKGGMEAYHPYHDEPIKLGAGVSITSPEGATFGTFTDENDLLIHTINDADGNMADAFVIEYIPREFVVGVENEYGLADTITLSNPTAFSGQDYVTTISSSVGTGIDVWAVYVATEDTWYGNGIFEFDGETNTLTVEGEYVAEGMQLSVVPHVSLTVHMEGGSIIDEYWEYVYAPDETGTFTYEWSCGEQKWLFGDWIDDTFVPDPNLMFERDGYTVVGYNTAVDGTGTAYLPGEQYELTEDLEIYLIWEGTDPVKLETAALSFKEMIHYNIFFCVNTDENVAPADMGLILFDSLKADGTMDDAIATYSGAVEKDGMYMVATDGIHAKRMADTIYFRAYARLADGSYVYSKTVQYSAVTYAQHILNSDKSDSDKALVVAMLNYGAQAQRYFGYNTENLANAGLTEEQKALVKDYHADLLAPVAKPDSSKAGAFASTGTGFTKLAPAVSFEGAFVLNYLFTPSEAVVGDMTLYYWTAADYAAATELTAENATGSIIMQPGSQYCGKLDGIFAKDVDSTVYVAAVYSDGTATHCTGVLPYSIGAYLTSHAAKETGFRAMAQAAAVYCSYCKEYFGS